MRGVLDLAALITMFDRGITPPSRSISRNSSRIAVLDRALDRLHSGRTAQHVHGVLKDAGLLEQDRLAVGGQADPFFARRGERLVRAVGVTRVGAVHVGEHQLGRGARQVVLELGGDERASAASACAA